MSDQNVSNSIEAQNDSEVIRKIKDFFGGIIDDGMEFVVDNKLIDKN
ncbi:hypothetical protein [Sulfuricurvum sp.]